MTESHDSAHTRLKNQPNILNTIASKLDDLGVVALEVNHDSPKTVSRGFSHLQNCLMEQRKFMRSVINTLGKKAKVSPAITTEQSLRLLDRRATLQRINDQLLDFICLFDCTIEDTQNNPKCFAGYYAYQINRFAQQIRDEAGGLYGDMK